MPSNPPNSSSHLLLRILLFTDEAGPPYSFWEFSPQTISGTLKSTAARTGIVKIPTCSGQDISPTCSRPILLSFARVVVNGLV